MDLKRAEIILIDNLKGGRIKKDDMLSIAKAASIVKQHYSKSEIQQVFQISSTSIDRINAINKLNDFSKRLVRQEKIGIEQAYHLSRLTGKRQDEAARIIASMNAHNSRILVKMLLASPDRSVEQCKENFDKTVNNAISLVVVPMPNDMYVNLAKIAAKNKKEPQNIIVEMVRDFIGK